VLCRSHYHHGGSAFDQEHILAVDFETWQVFTGYLDSTLMVIFVTGVVLVLLDSARRWYMALHGAPRRRRLFGPPLTATGESKWGAVRFSLEDAGEPVFYGQPKVCLRTGAVPLGLLFISSLPQRGRAGRMNFAAFGGCSWNASSHIFHYKGWFSGTHYRDR